jgi:beta-galactosidase GanA
MGNHKNSKQKILAPAFIFICLCACLTACTVFNRQEKTVELPHLEKRGHATQLIVDGKPFLVLAGEIHNSSSSDRTYMQDVWPVLKVGGLNTVLAAVTWEQMEPEENVFDFSVIDGLIRDANTHDMKLIVLWFGSWKNGISSYQPAWVKKDTLRFPLVKTQSGASLNILSTTGEQTRQADTKAYVALMRRIHQTDVNRTVIMMQIENEVGVKGDTRDCHPDAAMKFKSPVPEVLMTYLTNHKNALLPELQAAYDRAGAKASGSWEEVFGVGDYTDELFMAWNYATYMQAIAEAGKAVHPVPVFVNAWLSDPNYRPGDYPSGGPQAQNHDVWRAGAPSIDMLCPDIYVSDFPGVLKLYSRAGNPLFVPESLAGIQGAANAVYAIGEMKAVGYSPFGIESHEDNSPLAFAYGQLASISGKILECQANGSVGAVWLKWDDPSLRETALILGKYRITAKFRQQRDAADLPSVGYALVVMNEADEYLVMGYDTDITFEPVDEKYTACPAKVQEGEYLNGEWIAGRWLNGDEIQLRYDLSEAKKINQSGQGLRFGNKHPKLQRVWLYEY